MNKCWLQYEKTARTFSSWSVLWKDVFDKERFEEIRTISLELISEIGKETFEEIKALTVIEGRSSHTKSRCSCLYQKGRQILLIER